MMRILFYVQSLLGRGHLVRAVHLCECLRQAGYSVLLADGGGTLPPLHGDIRRLRLPEVRAKDSDFSALVMAGGKILDDATKAKRKMLLRQAYEDFRPHIVIVESYPLGRRAFGFELDGLLQKAGEDKVLRLSSVRDILVFDGNRDKQKRILQKLALIDKVWVHGDEAFCGLAESLPFAHEFADKITYSGYIAPSPLEKSQAPHNKARSNEVIVSGGGGAVARQFYKPLLSLAVDLPQYHWRFLLGENFPDKENFKTQNLPSHITCEDNVADFRTLLRCAKISISQAGYNTVTDLVSTATPSLLQAFCGDTGGESEQPLRARLLQESGVASVLPQDLTSWTAGRLAEIIEETAAQTSSSEPPFRFASPDSLARQLQDLWSQHVE